MKQYYFIVYDNQADYLKFFLVPIEEISLWETSIDKVNGKYINGDDLSEDELDILNQLITQIDNFDYGFEIHEHTRGKWIKYQVSAQDQEKFNNISIVKFVHIGWLN